MFPGPHRLQWCLSHSKSEIVEALQPGNHLMREAHRLPADRYGDGGAELDPTTIDHTIAALQRAKALILSAFQAGA